MLSQVSSRHQLDRRVSATESSPRDFSEELNSSTELVPPESWPEPPDLNLDFVTCTSFETLTPIRLPQDFRYMFRQESSKRNPV
ncbi:hypothetical protein HGRIS_014689 [Hohenbuehelia grisea]|uniref:Uncharacterized protein n=1 Tax=Hohenbuehelia grisea TaxID=104357 RepID=A0ABR3JVN5_9AGAR